MFKPLPSFGAFRVTEPSGRKVATGITLTPTCS